MILGIGNDLIEVERIKKACERPHFIRRIYSEAEWEIFKEKPQSFAGNFAVKEAVAKAFGTGFRGFEPKDIEVFRDESGKPYVKLSGGAKKVYDSIEGGSIHVSISNTREYAQAFAVIERAQDGFFNK